MRLLSILALCLPLLPACEGHYEIGTGDIGATPGGVQDIGYARDVIANGGVPHAEHLPVEGLLSEHDLPSLGAPCEELLCARPALGVATDPVSGELEHWVQIGLKSGLPSPYQRPPIDYVMVIDTSGAMSIDMTETETAVLALIDQLGPQDRLGIVAFADEHRVLHPLQTVTDASGLARDIRALEAEGGWNLLPALEAGVDLFDGDDPTRLRRLGLMTCGYPQVNDRQTDPFSQLVKDAAADGIGTSVFGVLLGYSARVADLTGQVPGGSFHYLESLDKVESVFDTEFDYMVSPLAYDLELALDPGDGFEVAEVVGLPGEEAAATPSFSIATSFISTRGGAVFARLEETGTDSDTVASVHLDYTPETAHGLPATPQQTDVLRPHSLNGGSYWAGRGVRKGVALIHMAEELARACDQFHDGEQALAIQIASDLRDHLAAEAEDLDDDALRAEVELVDQLLANMDQ